MRPSPFAIPALALAAAGVLAAPAQAQTETCAPGQSPPYCEASLVVLTPAEQQAQRDRAAADLASALRAAGSTGVAAGDVVFTQTASGFIATVPAAAPTRAALGRSPGVQIVVVGCQARSCAVGWNTRLDGAGRRSYLPQRSTWLRAGENLPLRVRLDAAAQRRFERATRITARFVIRLRDPSSLTILSRDVRRINVRLTVR
jgi:hypothetical protein